MTSYIIYFLLFLIIAQSVTFFFLFKDERNEKNRQQNFILFQVDPNAEIITRDKVTKREDTKKDIIDKTYTKITSGSGVMDFISEKDIRKVGTESSLF